MKRKLPEKVNEDKKPTDKISNEDQFVSKENVIEILQKKHDAAMKFIDKKILEVDKQYFVLHKLEQDLLKKINKKKENEKNLVKPDQPSTSNGLIELDLSNVNILDDQESYLDEEFDVDVDLSELIP
uniref:Uncharacterized protein n=1 Tax=Clastoptera arizonana TaxID=38151 RepID=A0A1B6CGX5_9HEMI